MNLIWMNCQQKTIIVQKWNVYHNIYHNHMITIYTRSENCWKKIFFVHWWSRNKSKWFSEFIVAYDNGHWYVVEKRDESEIAKNVCLFEWKYNFFIFIDFEKSFDESIQKNSEKFIEKIFCQCQNVIIFELLIKL